MKTLKTLSALLLASLAVLFLNGCTAYDQKWSSAQAAHSDRFAGRWDGYWKSSSRPGEGGRLRCVFTPAGPNRYEAAFHANWKLFASNYTVVFQTKRVGPSRLEFKGSHEMPDIFGGLYKFHGTVSPGEFRASYTSSYDTGEFVLHR